MLLGRSEVLVGYAWISTRPDLGLRAFAKARYPGLRLANEHVPRLTVTATIAWLEHDAQDRLKREVRHRA